MDPERVLSRLAWRLRLRGAAITLAAAGLFAEGFVLAWPDDGAPQMAIALYVACYGLVTALWLPVYLRRPEDILTVERRSDGLVIEMASGGRRFRRMPPPQAAELGRALEQVGAARRLTARVVNR